MGTVRDRYLEASLTCLGFSAPDVVVLEAVADRDPGGEDLAGGFGCALVEVERAAGGAGQEVGYAVAGDVADRVEGFVAGPGAAHLDPGGERLGAGLARALVQVQ